MFGVDLGKYNGDASWTLLLPARTIIGTEGLSASAAAGSILILYFRRPRNQCLGGNDAADLSYMLVDELADDFGI